jgi:hypothetical protein
MFPPTELFVPDALLIVPLDSATPPIEFDTPPGVEIAPVARIVVCPLLSSELDISHPPIEFEDAPSLLMVPFDSATPPIECRVFATVVISPVLDIFKFKFRRLKLDRTHPPIELEDVPALLIVPLDKVTPPITLQVLTGFLIFPFY